MLSGGKLCSVALVRCIDCQYSSNLVDVVGGESVAGAFFDFDFSHQEHRVQGSLRTFIG